MNALSHTWLLLIVVASSSMVFAACTLTEKFPASWQTPSTESTDAPKDALDASESAAKTSQDPIPTVSQQGSTNLDDLEKELDGLMIEEEDFSDL